MNSHVQQANAISNLVTSNNNLKLEIVKLATDRDRLATRLMPAPIIVKVPRNNPGNIVKGNDWQGEVTCIGRFECFESPEHGIRAMAKLIKNYQVRHNLHTVEEIIYRWAPPSENNTEEFIRFVRKRIGGTGYSISSLIKAIVLFEQGKEFPEEVINRGVGMI